MSESLLEAPNGSHHPSPASVHPASSSSTTTASTTSATSSPSHASPAAPHHDLQRQGGTALEEGNGKINGTGSEGGEWPFSMSSLQDTASAILAAQQPIQQWTSSTLHAGAAGPGSVSAGDTDKEGAHSARSSSLSRRQSSTAHHGERHMWSSEETQALVDGCNKHGIGNWKTILNDETFKPVFVDRTPGDLKDRFRTYFPDAYHELYPNAKTHMSRAVRSKNPDGKSIFEKGKTKERRPFSAAEDEVLKRGYEQHGSHWAIIARDAVFEGKRKSTDLRDRFRNAFPSLYEQAGYKPRSKAPKKERRQSSSASSTLAQAAAPPQMPAEWSANLAATLAASSMTATSTAAAAAAAAAAAPSTVARGLSPFSSPPLLNAQQQQDQLAQMSLHRPVFSSTASTASSTISQSASAEVSMSEQSDSEFSDYAFSDAIHQRHGQGLGHFQDRSDASYASSSSVFSAPPSMQRSLSSDSASNVAVTSSDYARQQEQQRQELQQHIGFTSLQMPSVNAAGAAAAAAGASSAGQGGATSPTGASASIAASPAAGLRRTQSTKKASTKVASHDIPGSEAAASVSRSASKRIHKEHLEQHAAARRMQQQQRIAQQQQQQQQQQISMQMAAIEAAAGQQQQQQRPPLEHSLSAGWTPRFTSWLHSSSTTTDDQADLSSMDLDQMDALMQSHTDSTTAAEMQQEQHGQNALTSSEASAAAARDGGKPSSAVAEGEREAVGADFGLSGSPSKTFAIASFQDLLDPVGNPAWAAAAAAAAAMANQGQGRVSSQSQDPSAQAQGMHGQGQDQGQMADFKPPREHDHNQWAGDLLHRGPTALEGFDFHEAPPPHFVSLASMRQFEGQPSEQAQPRSSPSLQQQPPRQQQGDIPQGDQQQQQKQAQQQQQQQQIQEEESDRRQPGTPSMQELLSRSNGATATRRMSNPRRTSVTAQSTLPELSEMMVQSAYRNNPYPYPSYSADDLSLTLFPSLAAGGYQAPTPFSPDALSANAPGTSAASANAPASSNALFFGSDLQSATAPSSPLIRRRRSTDTLGDAMLRGQQQGEDEQGQFIRRAQQQQQLWLQQLQLQSQAQSQTKQTPSSLQAQGRAQPQSLPPQQGEEGVSGADAVESSHAESIDQDGRSIHDGTRDALQQRQLRNKADAENDEDGNDNDNEKQEDANNALASYAESLPDLSSTTFDFGGLGGSGSSDTHQGHGHHPSAAWPQGNLAFMSYDDMDLPSFMGRSPAAPHHPPLSPRTLANSLDVGIWGNSGHAINIATAFDGDNRAVQQQQTPISSGRAWSVEPDSGRFNSLTSSMEARPADRPPLSASSEDDDDDDGDDDDVRRGPLFSGLGQTPMPTLTSSSFARAAPAPPSSTEASSASSSSLSSRGPSPAFEHASGSSSPPLAPLRQQRSSLDLSRFATLTPNDPNGLAGGHLMDMEQDEGEASDDEASDGEYDEDDDDDEEDEDEEGGVDEAGYDDDDEGEGEESSMSDTGHALNGLERLYLERLTNSFVHRQQNSGGGDSTDQSRLSNTSSSDELVAAMLRDRRERISASESDSGGPTQLPHWWHATHQTDAATGHDRGGGGAGLGPGAGAGGGYESV